MAEDLMLLDRDLLRKMRALGVTWRRGSLPVYPPTMRDADKRVADELYDKMSQSFVDDRLSLSPGAGMGQRSSGVVIWQGTSRLDGKTPIVCILTGLTRKSRNLKTGPMLQTWILRRDMRPGEAARTRHDGGICGGCPHRMQRDGVRTCYVNVWQAPTTILDAYIQGAYPQVSRAALRELVAGHAGSRRGLWRPRRDPAVGLGNAVSGIQGETYRLYPSVAVQPVSGSRGLCTGVV